jgi:hypothetical protein
MDVAGTQSLHDEGIKLLLFEQRDWVDFAVGWLRIWDKFNGMVPHPSFQQRVERLPVEDV